MQQFLVCIVLLGIAIVLYQRYESNQLRPHSASDIHRWLQQHLLSSTTDDLDRSSKPILWIHVPQERNARHWLSYGSQTSTRLNQPYLELTLRSLLTHCDETFTICLIDDQAFAKLLPTWPREQQVHDERTRTWGLMQLLYRYGGLVCPLAFVCFRDLTPLVSDTQFTCIDVPSDAAPEYHVQFLRMCSAPKHCPVTKNVCHLLHTSMQESDASHHVEKWMRHQPRHQLRWIPPEEVGLRDTYHETLPVEVWVSQQYVHLSPHAYGLWIPAASLLHRTAFSWFVRMSPAQVMESNTVLGNYLLLYGAGATEVHEGFTSHISKEQYVHNRSIERNYVGFWKVPSDAPVWSLQPTLLGDHVPKLAYPNA